MISCIVVLEDSQSGEKYSIAIADRLFSQLAPKMDEEATSWIRRTKFSHTVCHRFDSTRLASVPFQVMPNRVSSVKYRPEATRAAPDVVQIQKNPSTNKLRAVSPNPETKLSDTFKEARSNQKRFSTPHPRSKEQEKRLVPKLSHKDSKHTRASKSFGSKSPSNTSPPSHTSPLRQLTSMKFYDKSKTHKESAWSKYFDHGGGRVTSVETADEHMADLSKLFLGLRFAHGAHSQLYHGIYMDEPVAVKIIRVPDDDENGVLGVRLENQFTREITLLSRLHHPNVVKVLVVIPRLPLFFFFFLLNICAYCILL